MKYIDKLNDNLLKGYLKKLYDYGTTNKYPLMELNGIANLLLMIKNYHVETILEIGTAISFSAHMMASIDNVKHIDTVERDEETICIAEEFIEKGPYKNKINLIKGDALKINLDQLLDHYDLILFDAAKAQNIKFFEKFSPLLSSKGIIVTDNILFHGCVEENLLHPENLTKNVSHMSKKIDEYNQFLLTLKYYDVYFLNVGDGQSIAVKKD